MPAAIRTERRAPLGDNPQACAIKRASLPRRCSLARALVHCARLALAAAMAASASGAPGGVGV